MSFPTLKQTSGLLALSISLALGQLSADTSGLAELDLTRERVKAEGTSAKNLEQRRADLNRWYKVLWHRGFDMDDFDPIRLYLGVKDNPDVAYYAIDRGFALLEEIQANGQLAAPQRSQASTTENQANDAPPTNWSLFHGTDHSQSGHTPDPGPSKGEIVWSFPKGATWNAAPVIQDGKVYLASPASDTMAYCLDEKTGAPIWKGRSYENAFYNGGSGSRWTPVVTENQVLLQAGWWQASDLVRFDKKTGEILKRSPATQQGEPQSDLRVAYKNNNLSLYLADPVSGAVVHSTRLPAIISSEPLHQDGHTYVALKSGQAAAFDAELKPLWKTRISKNELRGSPYLAAGRLYVHDTQNTLYAVDATNGELLWNWQSPTAEPRAYQFFSAPLSADGRLYIGGADKQLSCLDPASGKLLWQHASSDWIRSQPIKVDDTLYLATLDGTVSALKDRGASAQTLWTRTVSEHGFTADLVGTANGIIASGRDLIAYSLNPATGAEQWKHSLLDAAWIDGKRYLAEIYGGQYQSSPTVVDGIVYIGGPDGFVNAIDTETGKEIWRFEANGRVPGAPIVAGDTVFIGQDSAHTEYFAVDRLTGEPKWINPSIGWVWSGAGYADGQLFLGTVGGKFHGVDASTGAVNWTFDAGRGNTGFHPNPLAYDGKVISGSWNGSYYAFDQKTGEVLWSAQTGTGKGGDPDSAAPVLWNGRLIVQEAGEKVTALDPDTGERLWSKVLELGYMQNGTVAAHGNIIYASCVRDVEETPGIAYIVALDESTGQELWRYRGGGGLTAPVSTPSTLLFGSTADTFLTCLDLEKDPTSEDFVKWELPLGGSLEESIPALYGNKAFALVRTGYLFAIE